MVKKKVKIIILVLFGISFIIVGVYFLINTLNTTQAAILVESTPESTVFIDDEQVGRTPYEKGELEPKEVKIQLIPDSFEHPLVPYQAKVTLEAGIKTVIRRSFGNTEDSSSGEIISFEKRGSDEASVSVISLPDSAEVTLDGQIQGIAPIKISNLSSGDHLLKVTLDRYTERSFTVKPVKGYLLTAAVQLSLDPEYREEIPAEETVTDDSSELMVEISQTSTGFLRVRKNPTTLSNEVAKVTPGKRYKFLELDEKSGWFKIEYAEGGEGWVSNQYSKKVELNEE